MSVTAPWQLSYDGLDFGAGSIYGVAEIGGLLDLPEIRTADRTRLRRHGLFAGDDFAGGRDVVVHLYLDGSMLASDGFTAAVDALLAATRPGRDELPLTFWLPGVAGGGLRQIMVRPRKRSLLVDGEKFYSSQVPEVLVSFVATDPRIYDANVNTSTITLPSAGGGLTFPLTFPLTFGAAPAGGVLYATNAGTFETEPVFNIAGPVANPVIRNLTADKSLAFNITLGAGETLTVDTKARTVLLGGSGSRYSSLAVGSRWFALDPGTSEIDFRASAPAAGTLTTVWSSAWL